MSVKVRQYNKRGKSGWEVAVVLKMPDGEVAPGARQDPGQLEIEREILRRAARG